MYEYAARVSRIIDGDTVVASIDLGFGISSSQTLRLFGINAPELHGSTSQAGAAAKAYLFELLESFESLVVVRTHKDKREKYGRFLAELIGVRNGVEININEAMVRDGHAETYLL